MFKSYNVVARIFERQVHPPRPGTSIHRARRFYENLVPSSTIYNIDCPDLSFRKFTDDGRYLISFSRNHRELIVYRPAWMSFSCSGQDCDAHDLPLSAKKFDSFFTQLCRVTLSSGNELICKDFFIYLESKQFGLFATSTAQVHNAPLTGGAVQGVPLIERITFHLLRLEDGLILDKKVFHNDFINVAHNMGVYLYDDMISFMSLRFQTIHILQIRDTGNLVNVRSIGKFCLEDDELFLNSSYQSASISERSMQNQTPVNDPDDDLNNNPAEPMSPFLGAFKQRLLSFIFQGIWNEEVNETARVQNLKKKFYFHYQDYLDLIIWRVQFLDRQHLLVKFGSVEGGISRHAEQHPAFYGVYNMEAAQFVAFYQNSSDELYSLFEQFCDHFQIYSNSSLHMKFISCHSNNVYAFEQLACVKDKPGSFSMFVRKALLTVPFICQSLSPSPYFDQSLFKFDDKLISPADRHRHCTDHPIKFIARRQPKVPKFKIKPGLENGSLDPRVKKISSFLFHPYLPLVISVQQTLSFHSPVVNIHYRRC